jgi:hypothetical protein
MEKTGEKATQLRIHLVFNLSFMFCIRSVLGAATTTAQERIVEIFKFGLKNAGVGSLWRWWSDVALFL